VSETKFKKLIAEKKLICPQCKQPIKTFDKFIEMTSSIWDGAGDSNHQVSGSKVTLICANSPCTWTERTEYWENYIQN
jgi:hypothetical protein